MHAWELYIDRLDNCRHSYIMNPSYNISPFPTEGQLQNIIVTYMVACVVVYIHDTHPCTCNASHMHLYTQHPSDTMIVELQIKIQAIDRINCCKICYACLVKFPCLCRDLPQMHIHTPAQMTTHAHTHTRTHTPAQHTQA